LVLFESCLISVIGGLLGLGLALLITAGGSPVPMMFPIFYIPSQDIIVGIILIIAMGIIAGIIPAIQAMRLKIAEALRREG
jgi:putative ABC transport system permease protein